MILGAITRPRDLADAPWVRHSLVTRGSMHFSGPNGAVEELTPHFRAEANSGTTILSLLVHGAGVGVLPEHALMDALHRGQLVSLCPGWIWKSVSLYAVTPSRPSNSASAKAFITRLRRAVAEDKGRFTSL